MFPLQKCNLTFSCIKNLRSPLARIHYPCMVSPRDCPDQLDRGGPTQFHQTNLWITRYLICRTTLSSWPSVSRAPPLISDLATCFNIVHGHCSLEFAHFFTFSHNPFSRGHSLRLSIPLVKTNSAKYVFSSRVVQPWNSLPADVVTFTDVKLFKRKLAKLNLSKLLTLLTFIQT